MSETTACPNCGNEYNSLGMHWSLNRNCDHPPLNETQKGVIRYFYEKHGFGSVVMQDHATEPNFVFTTVSRPVCEEIQDHLSWLSGGITVGPHPESSTPIYKLNLLSHPYYRNYLGDNPTVKDPTVVESTFDAGVARWQKHGLDRLYLNGFDGDPYIDLDGIELDAPEHLGMKMDVEGDTVRVFGQNVYGEYEIVIDLLGE